MVGGVVVVGNSEAAKICGVYMCKNLRAGGAEEFVDLPTEATNYS